MAQMYSNQSDVQVFGILMIWSNGDLRINGFKDGPNLIFHTKSTNFKLSLVTIVWLKSQLILKMQNI